MIKHRVVEKRGRFYPQYYVPEKRTPFLFFFETKQEGQWMACIEVVNQRPGREVAIERSFSTKEQAVLWIKTGSPYHPDKIVWEE